MTLPGVAWGDTIADGRFFVSCRLSWPVARRFPGTWFAASGTTVVLGSGREWKGGGAGCSVVDVEVPVPNLV